MQNILVVIDMQNDFVDGALGTKEAEEITENVIKRVEKAEKAGEKLIFTRDTHKEDYLSTQEGKNLPIVHCVKDTKGWEIIDSLKKYTNGRLIIDKPTFGSDELAAILKEENGRNEIEKITLIGLCTDICVISNALLIKAFLPEVKIVVESDCCAGVSPETHDNALKAMKVCQIEVV